MEINKISAGRRRKFFLIAGGFVLLAILALSVASALWRVREIRNGAGSDIYGQGRMMNRNGGSVYSAPAAPNTENKFILPDDALKSGELAIVVSNLEAAKKAVADIAAKNSGNVYSTFISYASGNVKNGSIVVQVPVSNFDATFGDLKKVGNQIMQESTRQIPLRNNYAVPMMGAAGVTSSAQPSDGKTAASTNATSAVDARPEIAIYPNPIAYQQNQDKGYVRIVFVDYGVGSTANGNFNKNAGLMGGGMNNNLWVPFIIKLDRKSVV